MFSFAHNKIWMSLPNFFVESTKQFNRIIWLAQANAVVASITTKLLFGQANLLLSAPITWFSFCIFVWKITKQSKISNKVLKNYKSQLKQYYAWIIIPTKKKGNEFLKQRIYFLHLLRHNAPPHFLGRKLRYLSDSQTRSPFVFIPRLWL